MGPESINQSINALWAELMNIALAGDFCRKLLQNFLFPRTDPKCKAVFLGILQPHKMFGANQTQELILESLPDINHRLLLFPAGQRGSKKEEETKKFRFSVQFSMEIGKSAIG